MLKNVFLKSFRDLRRSILFWGIGLLALALLMTMYYPSIAQMKSINQYIEGASKQLIEAFTGGGMIDLTSPTGYFNTELFSLMVPLLLIVFGVGIAANAVAGEEEKRTLDFMLSLPVSRRRFLIQKLGLVVVSTVMLAVMFWLGMVIGIAALHIDISLLKVTEAVAASVLLTFVFSSLTLMVGCWRGSKSLAMGVGGGIAAVMYFLNVLSSLVDSLKPLRVISPFYHYTAANTLAGGFDAVHIPVLLGMAVIFFAISFPLFERRDIGV
jgi:ABC-2 type transport system permease protein